MASYRTWLKSQGPAWLRATNGQALSGEMGGELDVQQDRLQQGLLSRFPVKGSVDANGIFGAPPADALDQQGEDREMRRGPGESDSAYGARLWSAWDFKPYLGSHYAILRSLQIAGYANMVVVQDNGRFAKLVGSAGTVADLTFGTLTPCNTAGRGGAPGWVFDFRDDFYARFGIVFTADAANLSSVSGQAILLDIVNKTKASNKQYVGAYVILTGKLWGWPTGKKWGDVGLKWGPATRRFLPGDGSAPVTP